ncbi:MAG: SusC/RagA family TonB-linked outer membrane protein [Bacteroides sp.]|nr:SusC/RagA family TonB-linked outer membrane protein [Bacteroides sp.]
MKTFKLLFLILLASWVSYGSAEETPAESRQHNGWRLTGNVKDDAGIPLIGANVVIVGSQTGVAADLDGNFTIEVVPEDVLSVSYLGYQTQEIRITHQRHLDIVLTDDANILGEVTVTALGIKRERKALGYSIGEVKGDELEKAKEVNVINALAGKVPGLVISQTAGGPSGSSRVIIRGSTEMTGNNQPLYIIDGVPMDNTNFASAGAYGGYDLGDGISSINPDDIESISVLKGPAASALYGSRASHGVILITTKKAASDKKLGIEFNSTFTIDRQLSRYDNLQSTYGQGTDGRITGTDDHHSYNQNWGPKIDEGLYLTYFDGVTRPYKLVKNNINGFFRTGLTATNTLVINSVNERSGIRLSYTNMENKDIVPNTGMSRNTINLRAHTQIARKLDLDVKVNYIREDVKNRPALSDHQGNVMSSLMTLANTFDQKWLKNSYRTETGNYYDWNNNDVWNLNPYWIVKAQENKSWKDRFIASGALKYTLNDKFNVQLSGGAEINVFEFQEYNPRTTPRRETGYLQQSKFNNHSYNVELLANFRDRKGLFDYGVTLGGNIYNVNNATQVITGTDMQMRETVALQSFLYKEIQEGSYRKQINSVFGMANVGFNNYMYLDATLRMDHSSTLPTQNNTYVYPSVSGSFIFTEAFHMNSAALPFGKVRLSYAQVGSDADPYQLGLVYSMTDKTYDGYALATIYNSVVPNKDLKPTKTNSVEAGMDLKFLNHRMGLEVTYYHQRSRNQIMSLNTSVASGYDAMLVNAGEIRNSGVEIALNSRLVQVRDFSWDLNVNFSKNNNKVIRLAEGIQSFEIESARYLGVRVAAVEGHDYGAIMGRDFLRNANGDILINPENGYPMISEDLSVLGNATWDWTGGLTTNLTYKNISLAAIIDVKVGADLYSMTARSLHLTGKDKATLEGRDAWYRSEEQRLVQGISSGEWKPTGGYIAQGVIEGVDQNGKTTYTPNDIAINPYDYWKYIGDNTPVPFIYDNTYVKVREITLTYRMPKKIVNKFADDMTLSFVARNPFTIYKNIDNIDPDSNYNNSGGMGLEYGSLPSRRSFGFNINLKF